MAWTFPTSLFKTGTVLDWQEFNDQLSEYAAVVDGGLNEHNFISTIGSDLRTGAKIDETVGMRCFVTSKQADPTSVPGSMEAVPYTDQWYPISNSEITVRGPSGRVVVTYSWQTVFDVNGGSIVPGLQFVIEVDGAPRPSAMIGSGDMGNERITTDTASDLLNYSSVSVAGDYLSNAIEGSFYVDAGSHTVRLLARYPYTVPQYLNPVAYIGCIEGIAFHSWV